MAATHRTTGRAWMRIRTRIMRRDHGLCQACMSKGIPREAHEVDHIIPLDKGGTDADDNLQALCHDCHADKTASDNGKRRRKLIGLDGWPAG